MSSRSLNRPRAVIAIYLSVQESCLSVGIHPLVLEVSPSDKEAAELDRLRLDYHFTPVFEDDIPKVTFNGVDYTPGKVGKNTSYRQSILNVRTEHLQMRNFRKLRQPSVYLSLSQTVNESRLLSGPRNSN